MTDAELQQELRKLQDEFGRLPPDAPARAPLARLIAAIEQELDHTGGAIQRTRLLEDVGGSIRRFEVEHPSLTASLSQILNGLSSMGL